MCVAVWAGSTKGQGNIGDDIHQAKHIAREEWDRKTLLSMGELGELGELVVRCWGGGGGRGGRGREAGKAGELKCLIIIMGQQEPLILALA